MLVRWWLSLTRRGSCSRSGRRSARGGSRRCRCGSRRSWGVHVTMQVYESVYGAREVLGLVVAIAVMTGGVRRCVQSRLGER